MKKIILVTTVLSAVFLQSCKDKKDEKETPEQQNANRSFSVEVEAAAAKKDDFALYYTEDNSVNFQPSLALWGSIEGGNVKKTVKFELTPEKLPTDIRLDFGLNKAQDSVVISNVKVMYHENEYAFKGSDFFKYFAEEKTFNTKVDAAKGTITFYAKDGEYKTPFYYPTQLTIDSVKKITTGK